MTQQEFFKKTQTDNLLQMRFMSTCHYPQNEGDEPDYNNDCGQMWYINKNGWEYTGYATIKRKECKKIDDKKILVDGIEIEFDEEINEPYIL